MRRRIRSGRARALNSLREWHEIALEATGIDHTPVSSGDSRTFGEQLGPGRSSRAMAIVHIAMFDALNAIGRRYQGYTNIDAATSRASADAAVMQAAHDTCAALFPSQRADFNEALAQDLAELRDLSARARGVEVGQRAAAAILALRANDGSNHREPRIGVEFLPGSGAGLWRPDPVSQVPIALGARWAEVKPFVLRSAAQFRVPPPPALDSADYAAAFDEVKQLGGDGITTPTVRSETQSQIGIFWAYDGMPSLCAPPRLYNQIALQIAEAQATRPLELARLLALVNIAMAEAGLAIWESKYFYQFWRPVTGIREASYISRHGGSEFHASRCAGEQLDRAELHASISCVPLGHAGLVARCSRYCASSMAPTGFRSDSSRTSSMATPKTTPATCAPQVTRNFRRLSEAEEENGQSRVYLGIHWSFDKTEGIAQGRRVASFVMNRTLQPI